MAQHKSAEKRNKQSKKRNLHNKARSSRLKTMIKKVRAAKTHEEAEPILKETTALLDKYATKGLIHKNNAANKKRKLTVYTNSLKATKKNAE
jgi:small subunit ribosomal protein S20